MQRGEIWVANLNPNKGTEIGKIRPVVILQENRLTAAGLSTVIVAPLTSKLRPALEPLRVGIRARDRLTQDCHVMCEQLRAIDRTRIGDGPLTRLTSDEMTRLEQSVLGVLGMI